MPGYNYIAKTKDAKTVKGTEEADSKDELLDRLRAKKFFVISIKEIDASKSASKGSSLFGKIHNKHSLAKTADLTFFARNLATTLSSGVTLLRSLEIITRQTGSLKLEKTLESCCQQIKDGLSFCEAISEYPGVFSTLWVGIVRVGETSGNLPAVLNELADYLEMRMEFERKIKGAMIYPAILISAAVLAVFAFLKFIFPKFNVLFMQFDVELPFITKILFGMSELLEKHFLFIIIGSVFLGILAVFLRKQPETKRIWDEFSLKLPVAGKIFFLTAIERITSTLHILLDSGLPLVYTLEITARTAGNSVFEKKILAVEQKVKDGNSLSDEFRKQGIFPLLISEMSRIGEETGNLADVFGKVAVYYRKELTTNVDRFIVAFEPLMIIFMGAVIGGIVISLFLPLFNIASV